MTPFSSEVIAALTAAAKAASVLPAALLALVSVETNGVPFASDGTPTVLCEPAIFYRELPPEKRAAALKAGLAAKVWSRSGYADQGTEIGRRARCSAMIQIDEEAAYRSLSMGLGQVKGFNATHAGYDSAKAMFVAFTGSIDAQARAIVAVLPALGVMEPLKRKDWVTVAVRYNGPGERHNNYHVKLAAAYAHWDTALATGQFAPPTGESLGLWSRGPAVETIQRALTRAGFPTVVDGVFGPKTAQAVAAFQLRVGLPDTRGVVDQATVEMILHREADPLPQGGREVATESDLMRRSRIVQAAARLRSGALSAMGLGTGAVAKGTTDAASTADPVGTIDTLHTTVTGALDKVDAAKATASRAAGLVGHDNIAAAMAWAAAHPMPIAGGGMVLAGAGVAYIAHTIIGARVEDHRTGATA